MTWSGAAMLVEACVSWLADAGRPECRADLPRRNYAQEPDGRAGRDPAARRGGVRIRKQARPGGLPAGARADAAAGGRIAAFGVRAAAAGRGGVRIRKRARPGGLPAGARSAAAADVRIAASAVRGAAPAAQP